MRKLELRIPPVAIFIITVVVMYRLHQDADFARISMPFAGIVFIICFVLSGVVGIAGIYEFRKAKTTVNPVKPHEASSVVDSGIFAYSRNPMYLGLFLLLFGLAYWQQNAMSVLCAFVFVAYMNRFQIQPEERALERLFGVEYIDYKQRVRRWI